MYSVEMHGKSTSRIRVGGDTMLDILRYYVARNGTSYTIHRPMAMGLLNPWPPGTYA